MCSIERRGNFLKGDEAAKRERRGEVGMEIKEGPSYNIRIKWKRQRGME